MFFQINTTLIMRHIILTILFFIIVFPSCYKATDDNYNYYSLAEPEIELPNVEPDITNQEFRQAIINTETALLMTLVTIIKEAILQPALHGVVGNYAQTRACPTSSTVNNPGDTFDKTLTLNFSDTAPPNNTSCIANNITYSGIMDIIFEAPIGIQDPDDIDIELTTMTNFVANGYAFDLNGVTIQLEQTSGLSYSYTIAGPGGSSLDCSKDNDLGETITTSIPAETMGSFTLDFEPPPGGDDDINNPETFVNNPFSFSVDDTNITCTNATTGVTSSFCVSTAENIRMDPFDIDGCACPIDGTLQIADNRAVCDAGNPLDASNSAQFDFGDGTCDTEVTELEKVIEFISYEGTITAEDGPADGMTSTDVLVFETDGAVTLSTNSLQLTGTGSTSSDFVWAGPSPASGGMVNNLQIFNTSTSSELPWINEFHYANDGTDINEFVEIAGPAGTDLSDYTLYLYNGNGNVVYNTENLSGIIPDQSNGFGTLAFPISGIQNGPADGFALVKDEKMVDLEFCE